MRRVDGVPIVPPATLAALVEAHGGVLDPGVAPGRVLERVGPADASGDYTIAPLISRRGVSTLVTTAPVLLVAASLAAQVGPAGEGRRWVHPHAERVLAALLACQGAPPPFVDAWVHPDTDASRAIVEPGARVGRDVVLGEGTRIATGAIVYPGVRLGARVVVGPGAIVGAVGFGFVDGETAPLRLPHRAGVLVGDDVELGAACTIDAGILAPTVIGALSKLDAQVHVGHGVQVGARCRIAAQVGLAGSVVVDDEVWIGGQAGVADHVRIGRAARVAAKAGVIGDVPPGAVFAGYPAVERGRWLRGHARLYRRS